MHLIQYLNLLYKSDADTIIGVSSGFLDEFSVIFIASTFKLQYLLKSPTTGYSPSYMTYIVLLTLTTRLVLHHT